MKILHINNIFSNFGGAENVLISVSELLNEQGHESLYFATDKKPYFIENYEKSKYFPKYNNFSKISFLGFKNVFNLFFNREAKANLNKLLKQEKPDLIIIHNFIYNLTDSIFDSIAAAKIPTILFLHDPRLFCPGGTLTYKEALCTDKPCLKGNALKCVKRKCKNSSLFASLFAAVNHKILTRKKIFKVPNAIICPSNAMINLAIQSGVDEQKLFILPHFVEEQNSVENIEPKKEYFFYCGRLDKEKGVEYLIKAMSLLPRDIKLKIAGNGQELTRLIKLAKELKLDNIEFLGYIEKKELSELYKKSIATILPCNWFETFGLTIIESFLNKTPVIGSAVGAIPELIDNNKDGILVEPKNIENIASAITYLNNNIEMAQKMGECGYDKAKTHFSKHTYLKKLNSIISQIASNQKS